MVTDTGFNYTGGVQKFTAPVTGTYQLNVYGAQGGSGAGYYSGTGVGGNGGYAKGNVILTKGQTIYVVVGGMGSSCSRSTQKSVAPGGYNGGGNGKDYDGYGGGGGGGCTHIGSHANTLKAIASKTGLFIVAGGGGGGTYLDADSKAYIGGTGGGTTGGSTAHSSSATGGTQTAAGNVGDVPGGFGYGASCPTYGHAGGGGGLYGGGAGCGGSGYIGGVSSGSTSNGARSGNGYALIRFVSAS